MQDAPDSSRPSGLRRRLSRVRADLSVVVVYASGDKLPARVIDVSAGGMHLRAERTAMVEDGLVHGESKFPLSLTLITAIILLLIGIFAIVSMVFRVGPFG